MTKPSASPFKSAEGEAAYKAAYDRILALWGVAYECLEVSTRFGITHVMASGPKDAPPLILLHGMGASSTFWFPNISELSPRFRTFAVDVIGDLGKSGPTNPPKNRSQYGDRKCLHRTDAKSLPFYVCT
jgi:pimeloyl-ACP methyl ester carboxylesterase